MHYTDIICAVLGSSLISTIVSYILTQHQTAKRTDDAVIKGVRALLRDRINERGQKAIEQGYIRADELDELIALHMVYHEELGGNGYLDTLMSTVKKLPIGGQNQ